MEKKINIEDLAKFCKKKGFVYQAASIYGGLAGFFDFGPLGVGLRGNIKDLYFKKFVIKREDIFPQDGSIITNPKVWEASGHLSSFGDLVLVTDKTKTRIRADHFIEDELDIPADGMTKEKILELIEKHDLKYNGEKFENIYNFSCMFDTQVGANPDSANKSYLRPETCQSIFPNFKLIADTQRAKLPFGIAQIGKAFRNEISPRDFIFRCREFEQAEIEYFYNPDDQFNLLEDKHLNKKFKFLSAKNQENEKEDMQTITINNLLEEKKINKPHAYWLAEFIIWFEELGLNLDNLRIREHTNTELSHYSSATFDIDYNYPMGYKELLGMANRGNYDLTQHQKHSKSKLEIFDENTKTKITPFVIEPSFGIDRLFMALIIEAYQDDKQRGNIVLNLNPKLAPYKIGIFPLMNKPDLIKPARELFNELIEEDIQTNYDKSGSIGKRYARADEMGIPYTITIDYDTIEEGTNKNTITIRDQKTTKQKRIDIDTASGIIISLIKGKINFEDL